MAKSGDKIFGRCLPKFAGVEQAFRQNFADGWEREGASVAIFWQGQLVVDLHGGYADRSAQAEWTEATRTVLFSATKAVAALAVHMVVEQRGASYSDAVTKYWPEFGQHGKAQLTVEDLLNHRAGLAALDEPVSLQDARKPDRMAAILEAQTPNWTPGTQSGYHAVTFGWLLDQLVRRMDKQGRSLSEFVRQEITDKHAIDFHLGLPLTEAHTVSRLTMPSWSFKLREVIHDPRVLIVLAILHLRTQNSLRSKIARNPPWIRLDSQFCTPNNPELYTIEQAGALGIGRARDLARIFALMLAGQFISPATLERISRPQLVHHRDFVLMVPVSKGNGFMYEPHPRKPGKWLFGHPGFGGTSVMVEPEERLVIAYVSNGLKTGMGELAGTYRRLRNAALEAVDFD